MAGFRHSNLLSVRAFGPAFIVIVFSDAAESRLVDAYDQRLFLNVAGFEDERAGNIHGEGRDSRQLQQRGEWQYRPRPAGIFLVSENLAGHAKGTSNREKRESGKHQSRAPE